MMIFGQGAIRCHPYVLDEMAAAQNNDVNAFDKLLFKHIGHVGSNKVRSFWLGLTRGLTSSSPTRDATRRYYQHMNRLSANLALLSDVSRAVLGGSLKRRERISARLGDVLSQLYLASAGPETLMTMRGVTKRTYRWFTGGCRMRCIRPSRRLTICW